MIRKVSFVILIALLLAIPYANGAVWKDAMTGDIYQDPKWQSIGIGISRPHLSVGKYIAIWNSSEVDIVSHGKIHLSGIYGVWQDGDWISIAHSRALSFYNIYRESTVSFNITHVKNVVFSSDSGDFAAVEGDTTFILSLTSSTMKTISFKLLGPGHRNEFLFSNGTEFVVWRSGVIYSVSMPGGIMYAVPTGNGYSVLADGILYFLDGNLRVISSEDVGGYAIYSSEDAVYILNSLVDDEGARYWIFSTYTYSNGKIEHLGTGITYRKPAGIVGTGRWLFFYDSKHIHILNSTKHLLSNNTFTGVNASSYYLAGLNGTEVEYIMTSDMSEHLTLLGPDGDNDWIPDERDPDDDNDGMPDWWEIRYGLDPHSASDRNMDMDHDGLTNYQEYLNGTDPRNYDTDGDGLSDGYEVSMGLDPLKPNYASSIDMEMVNIAVALLFSILVFLGAVGRKIE